MVYSKTKNSVKTLLLISLSLILAACASSGLGSSNTGSISTVPVSQTFDPIGYDIEQDGKAYIPQTKEENFSAGDVITISVNGLPEFSGVYTVSREGKIYTGHIGDVYVDGQTIPEVQLKLREEYNRCCLVNPNVSVEREQGQEFGKIVIDGAVNDAGVFEINDIIKLSEAIALAGGLNDNADPEMTILSREINGERKVSNINLAQIRSLGASDPLIYPNDVIFVQDHNCLLYTSPSPRDRTRSRMPSSA